MTTQTRLRGGVDNPSVEEPGGDEENPDVDDPSTEEPPVESFSPSWAVGTYSASVMLMGQETMMNATITDAGFDIQLTLMEQPISISSNEDGVTVTKNEKNDAEEKWTIVLSGISIAMGEDVTVTLTSVTANKELSGKVELGGKLGSAFNKDLSNITFSAEV